MKMSQGDSVKKCGLHCNCGKPAEWVLHIAFSGSIPYCDEHAREDEDFGREDPPEFKWEEIPKDKQETEHPVKVPGYAGSLRLLSEGIHRMRYSQVEAFYLETATELRRQAENHRQDGGGMVAEFLEQAAVAAQEQQARFAKIHLLCTTPVGKKWG